MQFSKKELKDLGFRAWNDADENGNVLMLIPLWMVYALDPKMELKAIDYEDSPEDEHAILENIDLDIRMGCVAYGILVKDI